MIDINIDYASDDSGNLHLWAKGHHDPQAFLAACESRLHTWDKREISLKNFAVSQTHWRTVRAPAEISSCGVSDYIRVETAPGKGAYAVTVLDEMLPM